MKCTDKKNVWLCDLTHSFQTVAMSKMPLAIGFIASYCTENLSSAVGFRLRRLRELFPQTVIVFGGPNFSLDEVNDH